MDSESRKRVRTSVPLLLTIFLVFSTIGCFLDLKLIKDEYDAVFGLSQDTPMEVTHIMNTLPGDYCIGANRKVKFSMKVTQSGPGPSGLDVEATIRDAKAVDLGSKIFPLVGKPSKTGSNFKSQSFPFDVLPPNNCIPSGGAIYVEVIPRGGSIIQGAKVKHTVEIK